MKNGATILSALLILVAALGLQPAAAQSLPEFPALTGHVVDEAGILPASARKEIDARLVALEAKSTDQLVVVTVQSLRGRTIEDYGVALGRHWKIGQAGKNNGVILLVAPHERKVRIEVGYGLEGVLSDAVTRVITQAAIVPRFRANDMAGGIVRGVDDIVAVLTGDTAEWQRRAQPAPPVAGSTPGEFVLMIARFVAVAFFAVIVIGFIGTLAYIVLAVLVRFATWIHILPQHKNRRGYWRVLNLFDPVPNVRNTGSHSRSSRVGSAADWSSGPSIAAATSGWSSSSGSSDSSGMSGGGGSFGGGGSSDSW